MKRAQPKLSLRSETVRRLDAELLSSVAGGSLTAFDVRMVLPRPNVSKGAASNCGGGGGGCDEFTRMPDPGRPWG